MERREFLLSAGAASTAVLLPSPGHAASSRGLIDVHAHVFNDKDIPGWNFFWVTIVQWYEPDTPFEPVDDFSAREVAAGALALQFTALSYFRSFVPGAEEEIAIAQGNPPEQFAVERTRPAFRNAVAQALIDLYSDNPTFLANYPSEQFYEDIQIEDGPPPERIDPVRSSAAIRAQLELELPEAAAAMRSGMDGAQSVADYLISGRGTLAAFWEFVQRLSASKKENIDKLITLYADDGPALFAPALVDFSGWLNEDPQSSIEAQIVAMELLQRTTRVPVHMVVPFNPWRQLLADIGEATSPLDTARRAIKESGAIGVKVYPPMGFLPLGNDGSGLRYQARAKNKFGDTFPALIDAALRQLYALCVEFDVPVLAHASSGNGAGDKFGDRADPRNWEPVLGEYAGLRICLAHFGGYRKQLDPTTGTVWELASADLMETFPDRVFVDTAFQAHLLGDPSAPEMTTAVQGLTSAVAARDSKIASQLVYGSDWHMLARLQGAERYPDAVEALLTATNLGSSAADIFRLNAVKLYGLASGTQTYRRLEAYYSQHGMDFGRVTALSVP